MQIKQEIKRKKNPLEEREERVGSQGGEKKHGQVARLEPSLGQEVAKVSRHQPPWGVKVPLLELLLES